MKQKNIIVLIPLLAVFSSLIQQTVQFKQHSEQLQHSQSHEKVLSDCQNPDILPQIDGIGVATDLLYLDKKENIFDFSCLSKKLSLDGLWLIPDGLDYQPLLLMSQQNKTLLAQNLKEFQEIKIETTRTIINDTEYVKDLNKIAGALNKNITLIEEKINYQNVVYQKLTTSYANSRAFIKDYSLLQLTKSFSDAVQALPENYNEDTYRQFIVKYGTHYRQSIRIGGLIEQVGYTNRTYTQYHTLDEIGDNFLKNFVQEELQRHFSINHIPTQLIDKHPTQDYLDNTELKQFFIKGGNYQELEGWVGSLEKNPVVIQQTLVNMTHVLTKDFFPTVKNINKISENTGKAIKAYLIDTQGCTNKKAINYNEKAIINDNSCFFTVFDGSYQTANSQQCTQDMTDTYQIPNPKTNDITCSKGSNARKVAIYDYSGCMIEQFFCIRDDPLSELYPDLYQSLQFCENRTVTDVFYEPKQQYLCDTNNNQQNKLFFNFKNDEERQINTCLQQFCFNGNTDGIKGFINKHEGTCTGVEVSNGAEDIYSFCQSGCLIMYGKVKIAKDCDVLQLVCIDQERDIKCYNN